MAEYEKKEAVPGLLGFDRPQPHNLEAERAVLAAMLREPKPCVDLVVEQFGDSAEYFYSPVHRAIFKAIYALYKDGESEIDLVSVAHKLEVENRLDEIGGRIALIEISDAIATTVNLDTWCKIVRDLAILRNMIGVCSESLLKCYDASEAAGGLIGEIEQAIFNVRNQHVKSQIVSIQDAAQSAFENIWKILNKEVEPGIPTGYPELDRYTAGLKPGEMFVLAARPSIGKTAIALNFVRNIALNQVKPRKVAFFSLEMTAEMITQRLLCTEAKVSPSSFFDGSFKSNTDIPKLTQAVSVYRNAEIYIDPTSGLTIAELRAKARWMKATHDIDVVVLDYLQLMSAGSRIESRQQEVAEISGGLKRIAKELNIPVLVLAQLNREIEKTAGASARPKLSHLRESGAIEQDADVVAFLHRNRDEAKNLTPEILQNGLEAELIVEKNRNGQTGIVNLRFFPQYMEFVNASKHASDLPQK